ncbi:hypothetical protein MI149_29885 (plasmid) [Mycolicibacterium crocinum]|uniref:Uncharacterized protein n=1 Tax=Mycolicibacterium crocinum TaxID=388459 RepID=A0ABY3TWH1_9MYCO|nr:hypothetical protein [Mycolicibacterium crocinum]ULN44707.1 hypothetical protein MI149_29885 [Mycolicibacterium crocinum]
MSARRVGPPRRVGRPSLGDRVVVKAALDLQELAVVDVLRGEMERSTFLGVIFTEHIGRPDLHPQPDQLPLVDNVLSLGTAAVKRLIQEIGEVPQRPAPRRRPRRVQPLEATVRVHPDVREEFKRRSQRAGLSLRQYNADVIRERLGIEPRAGRTEALPLAM